MTIKRWFSQNVGFQCWFSQNRNLARKVSCFPSMSESYYFYPPYQASMIAALSFKYPAICHRSPGENQEHQAVGTFWNARRDWEPSEFLNQGKIRMGCLGCLNSFIRALTRQIYFTSRLLHKSWRALSLRPRPQYISLCLWKRYKKMPLDGYVSLSSGSLFLILLRHMQFSQYKLSYFPMTR